MTLSNSQAFVYKVWAAFYMLFHGFGFYVYTGLCTPCIQGFCMGRLQAVCRPSERKRYPNPLSVGGFRCCMGVSENRGP